MKIIQVLQNADSAFVKAYISCENYEARHCAIAAGAAMKAKSDFAEKQTHERGFYSDIQPVSDMAFAEMYALLNTGAF